MKIWLSRKSHKVAVMPHGDINFKDLDLGVVWEKDC